MSSNVENSNQENAETKTKTEGEYYFGGLKEFRLEQIEAEVLNDSVYLDVFAGSDLRLKEQIEPLHNSLEKVISLNGINFQWNSDVRNKYSVVGSNNECAIANVGFVAQDVAIQMPELVRKDHETGVLAVNYGKISPYLVEAIKELNQKIQQQQAQILSLEKKLQERLDSND